MVYHILKDGTSVEDIKGRVITVEDAKPVYNLICKINSNKKEVIYESRRQSVS